VERLTVVGRDQLVLAVVWLATLDGSLTVDRVLGQLVGRVHPIDASVDVMLVGCANLQDAGDPVVVGLAGLRDAIRIGSRLLSLNRRVVGDVYESFAVVLGSIDWGS
jgi:hypothetical protein